MFVIRSESEYGFWSNENGWVYDLASASKFATKFGQLPISFMNDAEWLPEEMCCDFDSNNEIYEDMIADTTLKPDLLLDGVAPFLKA